MAPSLRKLSKRLHRTSPPDVPATDERDPQRLRQNSPEKEDSPAPSNDFSVPALSAQVFQRDHTKTPPSSKLQKWKSKSPAALFDSRPNAPAIDEAESAINGQAFSSEGTANATNAQGGASSIPPRPPTVRRVSAQGCEFEMMDGESANPPTTVEDPSTTSRRPASEGPSQRTTRSSTRRLGRADSLQSEQDKISTKDFASPYKLHDSLQIPGLSVRKQANKIPANNTTAKSTPAPSHSDRRTSTESPRTPSPREASASPTPPPPTNYSRPTLSPSSSSDSTHYSSPLVEAYKASTPLSIPETIPDATEPAYTAPSALDDNDNFGPGAIETVKVRPPIYNITKTAAQQWEHFGITSSRPQRAWDGCPRWTCCDCGAQTIVEQLVCANLECGHDRCYNRCQVVRESRKHGLFIRS